MLDSTFALARRHTPHFCYDFWVYQECIGDELVEWLLYGVTINNHGSGMSEFDLIFPLGYWYLQNNFSYRIDGRSIWFLL